MAYTVGIPRALGYYTFYPAWKAFFEELGATVIVSPSTNKEIMDCGVAEAVSEACVPIKVFQGHVRHLCSCVDAIFIPRLVNVEGSAVFCPKFLGLPEMVKCTMKGLPNILSPRIDLRKGMLYLVGEAINTGLNFTRNRLKILKAYYRSLNLAQAALSGAQPPAKSGGSLTIAVLGYPYFIHDPYLNSNLIIHLEKMGVRIMTAEHIPCDCMAAQDSRLTKDIFWHYSRKVLRAGYHFIEHGGVDGVIDVTAFGCGPDAMTNKILELEFKHDGRVPFMSLTIDEHTGEAGMVTRLEAFIDMIRRRKRYEVRYISDV